MREPYRVLSATQDLFKVCAAPANYKITEEERKEDKVMKLEDGEEVGHPLVEGNVWHNSTYTRGWLLAPAGSSNIH